MNRIENLAWRMPTYQTTLTKVVFTDYNETDVDHWSPFRETDDNKITVTVFQREKDVFGFMRTTLAEYKANPEYVPSAYVSLEELEEIVNEVEDDNYIIDFYFNNGKHFQEDTSEEYIKEVFKTEPLTKFTAFRIIWKALKEEGIFARTSLVEHWEETPKFYKEHHVGAYLLEDDDEIDTFHYVLNKFKRHPKRKLQIAARCMELAIVDEYCDYSKAITLWNKVD